MLSNSCTLSCFGCTNYSDYNMKGSLEFNEFKTWIDEWSKIIDIGTFGFMGGEPLINPNWKKFMQYTREVLPDTELSLITNATLCHRWPGFAKFLAELGNVHIKFSVHEIDKPYLYNAINDVLSIEGWESVKFYKKIEVVDFSVSYNEVKGSSWPLYEDFISNNTKNISTDIINEIQEFGFYNLIYQNQVAQKQNKILEKFPVQEYHNKKYNMVFRISVPSQFTKTWKGDNYYNMKPYNNNPTESFKICTQDVCPLLYKGRLYKCSSVALLDKVLLDHFIVNDPDWNPYLKYKGVHYTDSISDIQSWIDNFGKPHAICRMCPTDKDQPYYDHLKNVDSKI